MAALVALVRGVIQKVRASDRMSRSEIALPLPFPPTELQVMMGGSRMLICESKNLNLLGGGCKWARWAVREAAAGVWDIQVVVLQCRSWFHLVCGSVPPLPPWSAAQLVVCRPKLVGQWEAVGGRKRPGPWPP